jgi:hypothetical protein
MRRQNLEPLYDWVAGDAEEDAIPGSLARTLAFFQLKSIIGE